MQFEISHDKWFLLSYRLNARYVCTFKRPYLHYDVYETDDLVYLVYGCYPEQRETFDKVSSVVPV